MFTVNYLANVVLVNELQRAGSVHGTPCIRGLDDPRPTRVVVLGSGSYKMAVGRGVVGFFGAREKWNMASTMRYYGQTKYLMATWAGGLRAATGEDKAAGLHIVTHMPGPISSALGSESVPALIYPTYALMKWLFFHTPHEASAPLVYLTQAKVENGARMYIRQPEEEIAEVADPEFRCWLRGATAEALQRMGYEHYSAAGESAAAAEAAKPTLADGPGGERKGTASAVEGEAATAAAAWATAKSAAPTPSSGGPGLRVRTFPT